MAACVLATSIHTAKRRRLLILAERGERKRGVTADVACGNDVCVEPSHTVCRTWHNFKPANPDNPLCPRCGHGTIRVWKNVTKIAKRTKQVVSYRPRGQYLCQPCGRCFYGTELLRPLLPPGGRTGDPLTVIKHPAVLWLGLLSNCSLHFRDIQNVPHCKVRGCAYPAFHGAGDFCKHHNQFFYYPISMTDSSLSESDFYRPWKPHGPFTLTSGYRPASIEKLDNTLKFIPPAYSRSSGRMGMRSGGGSHSGSKTTAGKQKAASRQGPGSRHTTKEKRWDRATIEALEKEADKILGLDTPEVKIRAEEMRVAQFQMPAQPIYPLCQSYEILEEEFTEEEERDQLSMHVGALPFETQESEHP